MNEDQERKILYGLLISLIVAIIATAVIFYKPVEPYTTLYFIDPLKIKTNVSVNEEFYMNFIVENNEKEFSEYSYLVELLYYDNQTLVKTVDVEFKKIDLKDGEKVSISQEIVIREPYGDRVMFSVKLYKEGYNEVYRNIKHWITIK